jgi:hypothetical protein
MKIYVNGEKLDEYDYDTYEDEKGIERQINTHFKAVENNNFHIEQVDSTLICNICGANKFIVGIGDYFIAIKCDKCGWERGIADG